jgi:hypothetical protein
MIKGHITFYKYLTICYILLESNSPGINIDIKGDTCDDIFKNKYESSIRYIFIIENLSEENFIEMLNFKDSIIKKILITIILNNKI